MFKYYQLARQLWISIFNTFFTLCLNVVLLPYSLFCLKSYKGCGVIHILGTGPSLKRDMERFFQIRSGKDNVLCVNHFASTDEYVKIRPNIYLLVDNAFFSPTPSAETNAKCTQLIESLVIKTVWELNLVIPVSKIHSPVVNKLKQNKNINIYFITNKPVTGGFISYNAFLYQLGIATPLYQNVLNASVYFSVKSNFTTINIWGADHDWMEERTVLSDNRMYAYDRHFYSNGSDNLRPMNVPSVHGQFESMARCLRAYHEIKKYADTKNIHIINFSSKSWIDAFERK